MSTTSAPKRKTSRKAKDNRTSSRHKDKGICDTCYVDDKGDMVSCDDCFKWHHFECVQVDNSIQDQPWSCNKCETIKRHEYEAENAKHQQTQGNTTDFEPPVKTITPVEGKPTRTNTTVSDKPETVLDQITKTGRNVQGEQRIVSSKNKTLEIATTSVHSRTVSTQSTRPKSRKSVATSRSSISARLKIAEDENNQRELREKEQIELRMEQLKVRKELEEEELAVRKKTHRRGVSSAQKTRSRGACNAQKAGRREAGNKSTGNANERKA